MAVDVISLTTAQHQECAIPYQTNIDLSSACVCVCVCVCVRVLQCSVSCGKGKRARYVSCRDAQGGVADESHCTHLPRPPESSACFSPCGQWRAGEWSPVSNNNNNKKPAVSNQCRCFPLRRHSDLDHNVKKSPWNKMGSESSESRTVFTVGVAMTRERPVAGLSFFKCQSQNLISQRAKSEVNSVHVIFSSLLQLCS